MGAGKYSALSGALGRMSYLETISDNLANVKTVGFKRGQAVFESKLASAQAGLATGGKNFSEVRAGFTDFTESMLTRTNVPLHLGIAGEGFFRVQDEQGQQFYTRQGNMQYGRGGELLTSTGMRVLNEDNEPIILPSPDAKIAEDGIILGGKDPIQIPLYRFEDDRQLVRMGGSLFSIDDPELALPVATPQIFQGQIEDSNVKVMEEMVIMMETTRAFEACQKALKVYSDIGSKSVELGLVG